MVLSLLLLVSPGLAESDTTLPEYFRIDDPIAYFFGEGVMSTTSLFRGKMLANGARIDQADNAIERINAGEPITDFRIATYEVYNMPASENGLDGDLVRIMGTITEYVKDGSKSNTVLGFKILQEDGKEWIVSSGLMKNGKVTVGGVYGGDSKSSIFDGYEQKPVEIYGTYLGFSDVYNLPAVDITAYGGLYSEEDNVFVCTGKSDIDMTSDGIGLLYYFIGADRTITSTEPYWR